MTTSRYGGTHEMAHIDEPDLCDICAECDENADCDYENDPIACGRNDPDGGERDAHE